MNVGEISFYFKNAPQEIEYYIGYMEGNENSYWCGYCDIEDGCEFRSAEL